MREEKGEGSQQSLKAFHIMHGIGIGYILTPACTAFDRNCEGRISRKGCSNEWNWYLRKQLTPLKIVLPPTQAQYMMQVVTIT